MLHKFIVIRNFIFITVPHNLIVYKILVFKYIYLDIELICSSLCFYPKSDPSKPCEYLVSEAGVWQDCTLSE